MVEVNTKAELKKAIKDKEKTIVINDEKLAKHVINFKKIKKLSKWILRALLVISTAGVVAAPFTGGTSLPAAGALFSMTIPGGIVITTGALIAIASLSILGLVILYALYKNYSIEVNGEGDLGPEGGRPKIKVKLTFNVG